MRLFKTRGRRRTRRWPAWGASIHSAIDWLAALDSNTRRQAATATLRSILLMAVVAVVALGFSRMRAAVREAPAYRVSIRPQWVNLPAWLPAGLADQIAAALPVRPGDDLLDEDLTRRVGELLAGNAWIDRVKRVEKFADGRIELDCQFRRPTAVVHQFPQYYLLDASGVRLPGVYSGAGTLPLIQGVKGRAPPPGRPWDSDDLKAGLQLAALLAGQPFAEQVTGVSVHNFGGREDPHQPHLRVFTSPDRQGTVGGVILWGSAIGREIEEATPAEKLEILAANWKRTGRIDAGLSWIDVSIGRSQYRTSELAVSSLAPPGE